MSLVFILAVTAALVGLAIAMQTATYDVWGALLVAPVLLVLTVPLAARATRRENDPSVGRLVLLAVVVKFAIGTTARYVQAYFVYKSADAAAYYGEGKLLMDQFRRLDFSDLGSLVGTRFIEVLSGIVLAVIDDTRFGEFIVFSWISFVGLYFFYQAFVLAFPEGDRRRYRLLLFFWPSLLFWPSSVGKDAWMVLVLGMCSLGIANLLVGRWRGFVWGGLGAIGCCFVRPHLALMVIAGFAIALVLRRNRAGYTRMLAGPAGTAILFVGMIIIGALLFQQAASFFKLDSLDLESAQLLLESTTEKTAEGGSQFTPPSPTSPLGFVQATITVLFRPFPFEIGSAPGLIAGLEGVLLAGLMLLSIRRIVRLPRMMLRNPYVAYALGYSFTFIFAFASISNFGILARERSQLFPLLFVLLAIPKASPQAEETEDEIAAAHAAAL